MIMKLTESTAGKITYQDLDLTAIKGHALLRMRKKIQMIFQDPYASLNPRLSIAENVGEPLVIHKIVHNRKERDSAVQDLLNQVGLDPDYYRRYPFEFSGGQRQRIGIARALAVRPDLVIADEPVSALDVSLQAQVINLLQDLKEEHNLTYIFIAHDLSVVKHISDRVAVMYLGKIMEISEKRELFNNPLHPYTVALLSAIPIPDPTVQREKIVLRGDVPSPLNLPSGCLFHTRCPYAKEICRTVVPEMRENRPGHSLACHLFG